MTPRGIGAALAGLIIGVFSLGFFVWSGYIGGMGFWMSQWRCDDSCNDSLGRIATGLDWTYFSDSWQWKALGVLGFLIFCAGIAFLVAVGTGRIRVAWGIFAFHLVALAALLYIRSSAGAWDGEPGAPEVLASELGGLVAIRLRAAGVAFLPSEVGRLRGNT
jgi:hypothetical protein